MTTVKVGLFASFMGMAGHHLSTSYHAIRLYLQKMAALADLFILTSAGLLPYIVITVFEVAYKHISVNINIPDVSLNVHIIT